MPAKKHLAVVSEQPNRRRRPAKKSVAEAAEGGNHRDLLVSMRERIARAVSNPDCPPRDLAALTRRLQEIAKEIAALDAAAEQEAAEDGSEAADETFDSEAL